PHLGNVMNTFEGIAWAVKSGVVSLDLAWSLIGDWIMYYWLIFAPEITVARDDPTVWEHTAELIDRLREHSRKRGIVDPDAYYERSTERFLASEEHAG